MVTQQKTQAHSRQALIMQLYKTAFPDVAAFVRKMGGSLDEAKDVFQDALVIYYEKNKETAFLPDKGHRQYLMGIARHLWYKHHGHEKHTIPLATLPDLQSPGDEPQVSTQLLRYLELSGKRCLDLLSAFYYEQLNMKELARRFGFSGERSATAQKYKCLEKVREAVGQHKLTKDDFYD